MRSSWSATESGDATSAVVPRPGRRDALHGLRPSGVKSAPYAHALVPYATNPDQLDESEYVCASHLGTDAYLLRMVEGFSSDSGSVGFELAARRCKADGACEPVPSTLRMEWSVA